MSHIDLYSSLALIYYYLIESTMTNEKANIMNFSDLPANVQDEVKSLLNAYSTVYVDQGESGEYRVFIHTVIHNGVYSKRVGEYHAADVFTEEERILNYVRTFKGFPYRARHAHYTGAKDWAALSGNWTDVRMVDGNIEFIAA